MKNLKDHLLKHQNEPVVYHDMIGNWLASEWTPSKLDDIFQSQKNEHEGKLNTTKFRIGKRKRNGIQWESDCVYIEATFSNFKDWTTGKADDNNPLNVYDRDTYWCYADYKYMAEMCSHKTDLFKAVSWDKFGFEGRGGKESSFWLGSEGSYTPCHYDTYGCNLIAQIYGRKRWILVPPSQTDGMYPTRIPYEESSVFSQVNLRNPDIGKFPKLKNTTPYVVTLEPGQVLFVPRHWWHLVESLDTTISINTWLEMEQDDEERLDESIARTIVCSMMSQTEGKDISSWLNPTEEATENAINIEYINKCLQMLQGGGTDQTSPVTTKMEDFKHSHKKIRLSETDSEGILKTENDKDTDEFLNLEGIKTTKLKQWSFSEFVKHYSVCRESLDTNADVAPSSKHSQDCDSKLSTAELVNCLLHPNDLSTIVERVKEAHGLKVKS